MTKVKPEAVFYGLYRKGLSGGTEERGERVEDEKIVALYWERREEAVRQTQKKYGKYLFKIAYNVLSDREDCEECVNDTLLAAWNSIPPHRPRTLSSYLGKIVRQTAIDSYRKKHSEKRCASEYALSLEELGACFSDGMTPESIVAGIQLDEAVNRFVRGLGVQERNAFLCRYYFFDSIKDVAQSCGISQAKAKSMLFRLRKRLREYLTEEGFLL